MPPMRLSSRRVLAHLPPTCPCGAHDLHASVLADFYAHGLHASVLADFYTHVRDPGEEVVTKESFISICWRLIPYWLNNWEQQWGAECSSMMFELPHFAVELLVILPCVQVCTQR